MHQNIIKEGLALAKEAALAAAQGASARLESSGLEITDKDSEVDIVTERRSRIRKNHPQDPSEHFSPA
jgi:hypothetical protein